MRKHLKGNPIYSSRKRCHQYQTSSNILIMYVHKMLLCLIENGVDCYYCYYHSTAPYFFIITLKRLFIKVFTRISGKRIPVINLAGTHITEQNINDTTLKMRLQEPFI